MAKAKTKHKWTAEEVLKLLRQRYSSDRDRYILCEQVSPATGYRSKSTWIDAMVISCWPSDGIHRQSFEVKVARADFLSEINTPSKNAWFKDNSTQFWYVTAPGVVTSADEIPEGCGWLLAQKGSLVMKKQARTKRDITITAAPASSAALAGCGRWR